jgi:hypothetical protein
VIDTRGVLLSRLHVIAEDVGRLMRNIEPGTAPGYAVERLAGNVEAAALMLQPTAAELVACSFPDDADAVDAAIDFVDERSRNLRRLLGTERPA